MLVSALISWCNQMYQPDTTDYKIGDSQWLSYFNEALVDLLPHINLEEVATTDISKGISTYGLPTDFYKIFKLLVKIDGLYKEYQQLRVSDLYTRSGLKGYKVWETTFEIQPTPTLNVVEGLKIFYYKKHPVLTTTTDNIEISDPYLLGLFALYRVEQSDRTNKSREYYAEYLSRIPNLYRNANKQLEQKQVKGLWG